MHDEGGRHTQFVREHNGQIVALTYMSRQASGRDVTDGILSAMARQLKVSGPDFRRAIECSIDGPTFLGLLLRDEPG